MKVKKSAKQIAYDYISDKIIKGEYKANQKINDLEISKELGISKTPIREAIQLLEMENFLITMPKVGTIVTEIKIDDIFQLFEPLALIQGHACRSVCLIAKEEDIEKLYDLSYKILDAVENNDYNRIIELDEEFHDFILDLGNNPYIKKISNELLMQIKRIEYLFLDSTLINAKTYEIHLDITKAIEKKDQDLAEALMKENWLNSISGIDVSLLG
ncbi:MAG: GntR family transcriptional regulator, partial [Erysipelotrichales bacterium]